MAFILLLAIVGGVASTETGAPAQPIPPAGIYRSGGNLELTTPGSVICNGLDLVRDCRLPLPTYPGNFFVLPVRSPAGHATAAMPSLPLSRDGTGIDMHADAGVYRTMATADTRVLKKEVGE